MMLPDDPRHGTLNGYTRGCRDDCCRRARRLHETQRRRDRDKGIIYTIPATGTQRRIRALMRLGWTSQHIADQIGWTADHVQIILLQRERVNRRTAEKVAAAYELMSMKVGPSNVTRNRAAAKGWAPPLAWDDIDTDRAPVYAPDLDIKAYVDHAAVERRLTGDKTVRLHPAEAAEVVHRALRAGRSFNWIEEHTGLKADRYTGLEVAS